MAEITDQIINLTDDPRQIGGDVANINVATSFIDTIKAKTIQAKSGFTLAITSPAISGGSASSQTISGATMSGSTVNSSTLNNATINTSDIDTPTITGGTASNQTIGSATINSPSIDSPTITGGTASGQTISSATINSPSIDSATLADPTFNGTVDGNALNVADGLLQLDSSGKVPSALIPSTSGDATKSLFEPVNRVATSLPAYTATGSKETKKLTADANGVLSSIDGSGDLSLGDRVLVNLSSSQEDNGIYDITAAGDGSNPWELTRDTSANTEEKLKPGAGVYAMAGDTYGGLLMIMDAATAYEMDVDPNSWTSVTVNELSSPTITGGTASGQTISSATISGSTLSNTTFDGTVAGDALNANDGLLQLDGSGEVPLARIPSSVTDRFLFEPVNYVATSLPAYTATGAKDTKKLTADANGVLTSIDGSGNLSAGDRLIVNLSSSQEDNGLYTVTAAGDGSNPWELTRDTAANSESKLVPGAGAYVISGDTYSGLLMTMSATAGYEMDTDNITWASITVSTLTAPMINGETTGTGVNSANGLAKLNGSAVLATTYMEGVDMNNSGNIMLGKNITNGDASYAIGIGDEAMSGCSVAYNIGIGPETLKNSDVSSTIAIGPSACNNTSGNSGTLNIVMGGFAAQNLNGSNNVILGAYALQGDTNTHNNCTFVGTFAGDDLPGDLNDAVSIGYKANAQADYDVQLGQRTDQASGKMYYRTSVVSDMAWKDSSYSPAYIDGSGNIVKNGAMVTDHETIDFTGADPAPVSVDVGTSFLEYNSDTASTLTAEVPNGSYTGQIKNFVLTSYSGASDVQIDLSTQTTAYDSANNTIATIRLSGRGQSVQLIWSGSAWFILNTGGAVFT